MGNQDQSHLSAMCTVLLPKRVTWAKCSVLVYCAPWCTSEPNWVHRCTKFNTLVHLFSAVTRTLVTSCFVFKFWTMLFLIKISVPKTLFYAFLVLFHFISFEEVSLSFAKVEKDFWNSVDCDKGSQRKFWVNSIGWMSYLHTAEECSEKSYLGSHSRHQITWFSENCYSISWEYVNNHDRRNHWRSLRILNIAKLSEN